MMIIMCCLQLYDSFKCYHNETKNIRDTTCMVLILLVTSQLCSLWTSDNKSLSNNKNEDNERKITQPNKKQN